MFRFPKVVLIAAVLTLLASCGAETQKTKSDYIGISGEAQGTTYQITYSDANGNRFSKSAADSIFKAIDQSLSVWVKNSVISEFNRNDSSVISDAHFLTVYFRGEEIRALSDGAFEPMISPLVHAWGFGPDGAKPKGDVDLDSLTHLVQTPVKSEPADEREMAFAFNKMQGQMLDVNGIAQGYTVDVLAEYLESLGIENYMVEVGGEVRTNGVNAKGKVWTIGIDKPVSPDEARTLEAIAHVDNRSIATSGSYRKFYEVDGKRYSHTIDPKTGAPVNHQLLSATVLAPNCTNADAFATVFMVLGTEKTKVFIQSHPELELEVFLIYSGTDGALETFTSPGLAEMLEEV